MSANPPKKKRMPSDDNSERTPSPFVADSNHDTSTSTTSASNSATAKYPTIFLFLIRFKVVEVENVQL